jgi:thiamine biosynthesis lipoprotein
MMTKWTRRRFLAISAAACAPVRGGALTQGAETRWRGVALGAAASMRIVGLSPENGAPVLRAVEDELVRLENIFSLYRPQSALSRLNAAGALSTPPSELLEVLSLSGALHRATGGAFDPTVQPLFAVHATAIATGRSPDQHEIALARQAVGWDGVHYDLTHIAFHRKGAALTLNGIAQGFITDRIVRLLHSFGLRDVLVDAGEIVASGHRPDGTPWSAGIGAPDGTVLKKLTLADRALATSAPKGTVLDPDGRIGHIFDPVQGSEAEAADLVAVSAPSAAVADGLSTALCVLPRNRHESAVAAFPGARREIAI